MNGFRWFAVGTFCAFLLFFYLAVGPSLRSISDIRPEVGILDTIESKSNSTHIKTSGGTPSLPSISVGDTNLESSVSTSTSSDQNQSIDLLIREEPNVTSEQTSSSPYPQAFQSSPSLSENLPWNMDFCIPPVCFSELAVTSFDGSKDAACYLFLRDKSDCSRTPKNHFIVHIFWNLPLSRPQLVTLKSFFLTQDLRFTRLIIWTIMDLAQFHKLSSEAAVILALPHISIRKFVAAELLSDSFVDFGVRVDQFVTEQSSNLDIVKFSDLVRVIVLNRFGGIYVDMDSIFLRELSPLNDISPFFYRWSSKENMANTAVIGLLPGASTTKTLLEMCIQQQGDGVDLLAFHPMRLSQTVLLHGLDVKLLSPYLFDPIWLRIDNEEDLFQIETQQTDMFQWHDFFEKDVRTLDPNTTWRSLTKGAFIFHYHSRYWGFVHDGSYASMVEREFDAFLSSLLASSYVSSNTPPSDIQT